MRKTVAFVALIVAGCTQGPTSGVAPAPSPPAGLQRAFFDTYPAGLFELAADVCDGPARTLSRPRRNQVFCAALPDPNAAAALILGYDGTVQDLPTFVTAFSGESTAQGYLVTADLYIRVPQRQGGAVLLRLPDPEVQAEVARVLQAAGGRLL
ncbi:hypothetical protein [Thalassorhabdomicrobium marinisediminis]|uniref:Uncharacterized protein n=1 Tax=Thalassorhabdomicrobium marinisediminis TaxID=2170577 RepID=A0A2T7G1N7_9RHOB|nr:hypothetical protein [Thalassorhabdomicrobium marinisediminis]PVA08335.1 hypothetical protein DC363_02280 [Thalassorhabdomicrobium marinisediminis]